MLKFGGLAVALIGVAVFRLALRARKRARRTGQFRQSSILFLARQRGPVFGAKILGVGIALQVMSVLLAVALPGRL